MIKCPGSREGTTIDDTVFLCPSRTGSYRCTVELGPDLFKEELLDVIQSTPQPVYL